MRQFWDTHNQGQYVKGMERIPPTLRGKQIVRRNRLSSAIFRAMGFKRKEWMIK